MEVGQKSDRSWREVSSKEIFSSQTNRSMLTQLDLDQTYTPALVLNAKPAFALKTILL